MQLLVEVPANLPDAAQCTPQQYGEIRALLERAGTPVGSNDLWIAAQAIAKDLILATNNVRESKRIKGLKIENWAA